VTTVEKTLTLAASAVFAIPQKPAVGSCPSFFLYYFWMLLHRQYVWRAYFSSSSPRFIQSLVNTQLSLGMHYYNLIWSRT